MRRRAFALSLLALGAAPVLPTGATFTARTANPAAQLTAAADWVAPAVSLADPGSPLRGSVTLTATATDAGSGVARVVLQQAPAGSATWTDVCVVTAAPWRCTLDTTTLPDGRYDLRAVATDRAGNTVGSTVVSGRRIDNTAPSLTLTDPGGYLRGVVALDATADDGTGSGVATVVFQRSPAGAGTWATICTDTTAPYSCSLDTRTTATPDGSYDLQAVATDAAGNVTVRSATDVVVDNTAPATTLSVPTGWLRGVITFTASPSDAGTFASGVDQVAVQVSPAGAGTWTTACTTAAAPWSCTWSSEAVADGSYDLRAVVTDLAGNSGISSTVSRGVDNTVSSVYLKSPGAYLAGTATLEATVTAPNGAPSVKIQIAPTGGSTWTTLCTVTVSPFTCSLDTTTRTDGSYDFRAVLTDASGTKTSNVQTSVIDNAPLKGVDVQTANGTKAGKVDLNDAVTFTFSRAVAPSSLVAGWTAAAPVTVAVRLRDGGLVSLGGKNDVVDVFSSTTLQTPVALGTLQTRTDLIAGGKTGVFGATLAAVPGSGGTAFSVTVGSQVSGPAPRTSTTRAAMTWTPSSAAVDAVVGLAASVAPVTESGALDVDF